MAFDSYPVPAVGISAFRRDAKSTPPTAAIAYRAAERLRRHRDAHGIAYDPAVVRLELRGSATAAESVAP